MTCRGRPAAAMTSRTFSGETVFTHMLSDELYYTVVFLPVVCGRTVSEICKCALTLREIMHTGFCEICPVTIL